MSAINEAMAIATSDGLYDNNIAAVRDDTNSLQLNLKHTFALDSQAGVEEHALLNLGELPDTAACRCLELNPLYSLLKVILSPTACMATFGILEYFQPARGVGRTEAESEQRACEAVLLQGLLAETRLRKPDQYISLTPRSGVRPRPEAPVPHPSTIPPVLKVDQPSLCAELLQIREQVLVHLGWVRSQREEVWTYQPQQSGFSTGAFT
ncbi:hypothetical protein BDV93DRAFT_565565 [Ceratobasidium sp. AG-I]|nr:hypothetical protein BDV93DRAFT_565565 [Ceratobasidium sp. AG-I]